MQKLTGEDPTWPVALTAKGAATEGHVAQLRTKAML
jgi:hypothetical protein